MPAYRGQQFDAISKGKRTYALRKLNEVAENPKFKETLEIIYGKELNWSVDLYNTGNEYVKIKLDDFYSHDSDGLGEGLVNLLFLVSFLVESEPNELIVIDEPELSLHPQLQRNLLEVILDYTKDVQVLYATHSPEMVSLDSILDGGILYRVEKENESSKVYRLNLDDDTRLFLEGTTKNRFNPRIFGYDARSCFLFYPEIISHSRMRIYSKSTNFLKNYKIPLVCRTNITLLKIVIRKMLFLFYRLIIITKIANFRLIFPQMPMCLFSRSFHII